MIPRANITAWRHHAPWPSDAQVEQDLVLSRALVELFSHDDLKDAIAFRGGTALHKLFLGERSRYSEDIDLVQVTAGPIGAITKAVRATLDPWLGKPTGKFAGNAATLVYRFDSTNFPVQPMRLKVEINTREHFAVLGYVHHTVKVANPWFSGQAPVKTYHLEELLGTKLRALYQRKKGRDLYDLWAALTANVIDDEKVVHCFNAYLKAGGQAISRAEFERNMADKLNSRVFISDLTPLLRDGTSYDVHEAAQLVGTRLIARMKGAPWKGVK